MDQDRITSPSLHTTSEASIQPGSLVFGSDGEELGSVVSVAPDRITVKRRGLRGGTVDIPRSLVRDSEEGRVELTVAAKEAVQG